MAQQKTMNTEEVVAMFQEWQFVAALAQRNRDIRTLWSVEVVSLVPGDKTSWSLAKLFEATDLPTIMTETPFLGSDAERFGFSDEYYRKNFLGLRPDFIIQDKDLMILLEAKGRWVPTKTWTDPKERIYYRFLAESSISKKGFFYIIPKFVEADCTLCLSQHFQPSPQIRVGYILWENLLPLLDSELLEVVVDEMVRVSNSLRCLREWQKQKL